MVNYKVEYNFLEKDALGKIHVSLENHDDFAIKYNKSINTIVSNWKDTSIECPKYAAGTMANLIYRNICVNNSYPYKYSFFKVENNNTVNFFFDVCSDDEYCRKKACDLQMIVEDVLTNGVGPHHIALAKEAEVYDGFQICMNYYLGESLV